MAMMGYAIVGACAMFMTSNTYQHSQKNWHIIGNAWNWSTAAMSEWLTKTFCSTYGSYNPFELGWQKCVMPCLVSEMWGQLQVWVWQWPIWEGHLLPEFGKLLIFQCFCETYDSTTDRVIAGRCMYTCPYGLFYAVTSYQTDLTAACMW